MTDYVNAYAIPDLKIRGNDDMSQPELDAFLFATDQYDYRAKKPKTRATIVQKYRAKIASALRKLLEAKKRPKAVVELIEAFPDIIQAFEDEERSLLRELALVATSILKTPVHILIFEEGVLRTPPEKLEFPVALITLDAPNGRPALLYLETEAEPLYLLPPDHPTLQVLRDAEAARALSSPESTDARPEEEPLEQAPLVQTELYHVDELEFEPFDQELEIDRALPPPPAQMDRAHMMADMLKLVPENPHVQRYAQLLVDSLRKPPAPTRFLDPAIPLVRVDPLVKTHDSLNYVESMKDFAKATNNRRPYIHSVFEQKKDSSGTLMFESEEATRADAVLDNFEGELYQEPLVDVEFCHKSIKRETLEKFAEVYDVKVVKNKRRMCEALEPYLGNIMQVLNDIENKVDCDDIQSHDLLLEEAPGSSFPYHTAGFLQEDAIKAKGLFFMGDPENPTEMTKFDLDAYHTHLSIIADALPVRCELHHFAAKGNADPPLVQKGRVLELVDDVFLRVETESGAEAFYNTQQTDSNTFFLYGASFAGHPFHKRDLAKRNLLFLSEKLPLRRIREIVGLTLEQYLYIRRKRGFVDTPLEHDFRTTTGLNNSLREMFGIRSIEHLNRSDFEAIREEIEGADFPSPATARRIDWARMESSAERPYPFANQSILDALRTPPVLTKTSLMHERLSSLQEISDYPLRVVEWVQEADMARKKRCEYTFPSFEGPRIDPPGTVLHFETMEAMKAHREELEPYLQFKAEADLRANAQNVRTTCDSLEQIHQTHANLMVHIDRFRSLSRRSKTTEMSADQTHAQTVDGDLREDEAFSMNTDEQIQFVAPIRDAAQTDANLTHTLTQLLKIPMNQFDRAYIEREYRPYKVLLLNLFAAQKKGANVRASPQLEAYLEICARCSMICVYLMSKRELFPLSPKHAQHFSFDGFPLENQAKGVPSYVAHVLHDEMASENPKFDNPSNVEKTIRAAMSYFFRKQPSVLPMLKRKATEARSKAKALEAVPTYNPLPKSKVVDKVRTHTIHGKLDKDFRMFRFQERTDSDRFVYPSLVSAPLAWNRHSALEPPSRIRQARPRPLANETRVAQEHTLEKSEDQEELQKLLEETKDWAGTDELVQAAIRTPENASFHRVNVNHEMGSLGFSFDHPYELLNTSESRALFEKHAVRNDPSRGAVHNTVLMFRGTRELLKELFAEETVEGRSPFAIRDYIRDAPRKEAYDALQRAWSTGVARVVREIRYNEVNESKLREHSDVLRDADKQRALDNYADMDIDSRMVVKMVKDLVGIQPVEQDQAPDLDGGADNDFRDVRAEDDDQED